MMQNAVHSLPLMTVTVASNDRITAAEAEADVRELALDIPSADIPFEVGHCIGLTLPAAPDSDEGLHFRQYSIADIPEKVESGATRIRICVRRWNDKDRYTGKEHKGLASNYLCDLNPGDTLEISSPLGLPFNVPKEHDANLILIGTGTGVAPFRAFVKHIYRDIKDWTGLIRLFYGARNGLDFLYMNDQKDDLARYCDKETFEAFKALSPKPNWADPIAWDLAFAERSEELLKMLEDDKTYVYVAGFEKVTAGLDAAFSGLLESPSRWQEMKSRLVERDRWVELIY